MKSTPLHSVIAVLALGLTAFAGETDKKAVAPVTPAEDSWEFKLGLPGWIPWIRGDVGLNGVNSHISLAPDDIIPKLDMVVDVRAEAHKGRLSLMGELLYLSLSDGSNTETIVKKVDYRVDQTMLDLSAGWRLIESERGYLDLLGGVRYMNYYQRMTTQPDDELIDQRVDTIAAATRRRLQAALANALIVLDGKGVSLPIVPLHGQDAASIARKIERIRASGEQRREKIKQLLHDSLDSTVSRTDDWWDPYVGFRGRYNVNSALYVTARADIGGFTVGSDLSWTAEAGIGYQLKPNIFAEITYRALGIDYEKDGLLMDTVTHGPQVNIGIDF